jgi:hypothetical protein
MEDLIDGMRRLGFTTQEGNGNIESGRVDATIVESSTAPAIETQFQGPDVSPRTEWDDSPMSVVLRTPITHLTENINQKKSGRYAPSRYS